MYKRIISACFVVFLLLLTSVIGVAAKTQLDELDMELLKHFQIGDANTDYDINIRDATSIQKHIASLVTLEDWQLTFADANQDDNVDIRDATYIQKLIAGFTDPTQSPTTHTHSFSSATCTEPARCSCGATNGNPLGHNYSNGACSNCGITYTSEAFGYSVGDVKTAYNSKGNSFTLTYLGEDRWEDQNGHIWTAYKHNDGSLHWDSFFG